MASITWQGRVLPCEPGETVLDRLLRAGVPAPSSCRSGACQTCMLRAARGAPPAASQKGLKETLRALGYFLPCQCVAEEDLEVTPGDALAEVQATVRRIERPCEGTVRIFLEPSAPFAYRAGQFVHVARADGLVRPYSLASTPTEDTLLELHVRKLPGGVMSGYLHDTLAVGDTLTVRGPAGNCFYVEGKPDQALVLAGTGTGLAPLVGIAREAIALGHRGTVLLHHGALSRAGLYADAELRALAERHPTLAYVPCVLQDGGAGPPVAVGSIDDIVLRACRAEPRCRVFLCGPPERVQALRKAVFLAGVSLREIFADAFVSAPPPPAATAH